MAVRREINPWGWSEALGFVQAVESREIGPGRPDFGGR